MRAESRRFIVLHEKRSNSFLADFGFRLIIYIRPDADADADANSRNTNTMNFWGARDVIARCFRVIAHTSEKGHKKCYCQRHTKSVLDQIGRWGEKCTLGGRKLRLIFLKGNGDKISLNRCRLGSDMATGDQTVCILPILHFSFSFCFLNPRIYV